MRRCSVRPLLTPLFLLALAVGAGGCRRAPDGARSAAPSRQADLITLQEIEPRSWNSIYEVVATLRPIWLNSRGRETLNMAPVETQAIVDGVRMGPVHVLETIPVQGVQSIRFIDGNEATARWGLGYGKGAIYVVTTRSQKSTPW